jgi:hypothetical protein
MVGPLDPETVEKNNHQEGHVTVVVGISIHDHWMQRTLQPQQWSPSSSSTVRQAANNELFLKITIPRSR